MRKGRKTALMKGNQPDLPLHVLEGNEGNYASRFCVPFTQMLGETRITRQ